MKQQFLSVLPLVLGSVVAGPVQRREVPQEHSHENILRQIDALLQLNNPNEIQASVFGLLGAAAAAGGAGKIADADCLQLATADQAFSNAKEANDVDGQVAALIYRALERNTGSVGLASVPCVSIEAVNPEIAALQQHQDPAGDGAIELNKQIATELVKQILAVGGDAALANEASTFAPGEIGDPTAKGNTCDDENDLAGCINSLNLRVDDLSAAEIDAIVAGADAGGNAAAGNATGVADLAAVNGTAAACNATNVAGGKKNKDNKKANKKNKDAKKNDAKKADAKKNDAKKADAKKADAKKADAKNANAKNANAHNNVNLVGNDNLDAAIAQLLSSSKIGIKARRHRKARQAANFGSCSDPTITFGLPSDGRKEDAFEATDLTNFPHGSALNIKVISQFICDQLTNKCKANAEAVALCDQAAADSAALKAQAAADAFNAALGF
jgi:hypothetical protein